MQVQKLAVIDIRQEVKIITSCFLDSKFYFYGFYNMI